MSTGSGGNNGNVNVVITATDAASAVFARFADGAVKGVEAAIDSLGRRMGAADPEIEAASGALGAFMEIAKNPSPLGLLKGGVQALGVAWQYAAAKEEEANKALEKYNATLRGLLPTIKQVEDLQFENSLFGKGDFDKAMARKKRELDAVDTSKMTPQEKELFNQNKRITLEQYADQLRRKGYNESQAKLETDAAAQLNGAADAVHGFVQAIREETANLGKSPKDIALAQFDKAFLNTPTDKLDGDQLRNLGQLYATQRALLKSELELKAAKEAELSYVRLMNQLETDDRRDRLRQQRLDRNKVQPQQPDQTRRDGGNQANLWETGFLTRAGSDTFDPALATQKEQLAELRDTKRLHIQELERLDAIKRWADAQRAKALGAQPIQ